MLAGLYFFDDWADTLSAAARRWPIRLTLKVIHETKTGWNCCRRSTSERRECSISSRIHAQAVFWCGIDPESATHSSNARRRNKLYWVSMLIASERWQEIGGLTNGHDSKCWLAAAMTGQRFSMLMSCKWFEMKEKKRKKPAVNQKSRKFIFGNACASIKQVSRLGF